MIEKGYDIDQIVSTTHHTVDMLLQYKNGPDALALYFRYIKQRKMQENVNTYSTDVFMIKAMGWGKDRFQKAKKILRDLGMIETNSTTDENGKIIGWYVKVNFMITRTPDSQTLGLPDSGKQETNTLVYNINTLESKRNTLEKFYFSLGFSDKVTEWLVEFDKQKKKKLKTFTKVGLKLWVDKLKRYGIDEDGMIEVLKQSISNGREGLYELSDKKKPPKDRRENPDNLTEEELGKLRFNCMKGRKDVIEFVKNHNIVDRYGKGKLEEYRQLYISKIVNGGKQKQ